MKISIDKDEFRILADGKVALRIHGPGRACYEDYAWFVFDAKEFLPRARHLVRVFEKAHAEEPATWVIHFFENVTTLHSSNRKGEPDLSEEGTRRSEAHQIVIGEGFRPGRTIIKFFCLPKHANDEVYTEEFTLTDLQAWTGGES